MDPILTSHKEIIFVNGAPQPPHIFLSASATFLTRCPPMRFALGSALAVLPSVAGRGRGRERQVVFRASGMSFKRTNISRSCLVQWYKLSNLPVSLSRNPLANGYSCPNLSIKKCGIDFRLHTDNYFIFSYSISQYFVHMILCIIFCYI